MSIPGQQGSHLAAISPYFNVFKQPPVPTSSKVTAAIYLFRHGIIEVSGHDYKSHIAPFLKRLDRLQSSKGPSFSGPLHFLNDYRSWITDAYVGMISPHGLSQSSDLGAAFRQRYRHLLSNAAHGSTGITALTDAAARCRFSAVEFARSFSGDGLKTPDSQVSSIDIAQNSDPRSNLCWHTTYVDIDQTNGQQWMDDNMQQTTTAACTRLQRFWPQDLLPSDVYSMQLLHCYDTCAGRASPFGELFNESDWAGFEYIRDGKYYFSEGPGAIQHTGRFALPWLVSAIDYLKEAGRKKDALPLQVHFAHREEVLYLCTLLGIGCYADTDANVQLWAP